MPTFLLEKKPDQCDQGHYECWIDLCVKLEAIALDIEAHVTIPRKHAQVLRRINA
jgi:hypothetical protein